MYIPPSERMKKVHVWLGSTGQNEDQYNAYFDQEEELSQFSKDIGLDAEYDEDFIGILPLFKNPVPIAEVLAKEVPIDVNSLTYAVVACDKFEIDTVNAVFYLTDSTLDIENNRRADYNGLKYIGLFKSSL